MLRFPRPFPGCARRAAGCSLTAMLVLLGGAALPGAAASTARAQGEAPAAADDITPLLDSIATAWLQGDAASLVQHFAAGRILLRLPGSATTLPQRISHQQSLLILRNHFESHVVRRFEFLRSRIPETPRGQAVGLAAVSWRRLGVGRTKEGRMLIVLTREAQGWAISEMQALP